MAAILSRPQCVNAIEVSMQDVSKDIYQTTKNAQQNATKRLHASWKIFWLKISSFDDRD